MLRTCATILLSLFSIFFIITIAVDSVPSSVQPYFGRFAGSFHDLGRHGISGDAYFVNKHALFLYNFSYDGQENDVYFKVGTDREPNSNGLIIADELGRLTKLNKYTRQNLLLTLPKEVSSQDIRWIALWNNAYSISIGQLVILHQIQVPKRKNLGTLSISNGIINAESIIATDDKTLIIRKFYYNSVINSNWGFYVGSGTGPNVYGYKIPDENGSFGKLRVYINEDIVLRLPRDLSLMYLDWFAIYDPQLKQSLGHIMIRRDLNVPPNMAFMLTYVTSFSNCEIILPNLMQIGWEIRHPNIYIQMEARIAFGLSGSNDENKMIGSDAFIAYYDSKNNKVVLEDFILLSKSHCNAQTRTGVCRDTELGGTNDLELLMSSYIDGLIKVTFRRPLRTQDISNDLSVIINRHAFVVAAIGTLDTFKNPSYHTVAVNTKYHLSKYKPMSYVDFGRPHHQRACDPPLWQQVMSQPTNAFNSIPGSQAAEAEAHTLFEIEPWKPASIKAQNGHVFRVVIGPAGNPMQGYTSITGIESSGMAFWIDDLLIPEIYVTRGHNYTFIVETGDNSTVPSRYHPFYITDSREGGGSQHPELLNSHGNQVYAGIDLRSGFVDTRAGSGRYCELLVNRQIESFSIHSIEEYRKTLTLVCEPGKIGAFQWRPDENTPDIVYYQCFTHRNLGWKIIVSSSSHSNYIIASNGGDRSRRIIILLISFTFLKAFFL